ncbi:MAG: hypothetical protein GY789_20235 [Hyphomicrobiales bacterium]|nr:hypothetical protein [Hyphomicrobiales bacterium]MCP4999711.1 hypothetical protein [Hyphomicrobiales bacterium]
MELNGIAAIAVETNGNLGEVVANATESRGLAMLLASPVDDALAGRINCGGLIQNIGCFLGIRRDPNHATARCCRSLGCVDSHYDNAGMYGSDDIIDRSNPMARGSDVNHQFSHTECSRIRSGMRKHAKKPSGNSAAGAATTLFQSVDLNRSGHMVPANVRFDEIVVTALPVAIKSSSKNVASQTAFSGRQLHTA